MTKEEIIAGNKLIAAFYGWEFIVKKSDIFGEELIAYHKNELMWRGEGPEYLNRIMISDSGFAYHKSWEKIRGVIEKIHDECKLYSSGLTFFDGLTIFSTIEQVWHACTRFAYWYNTKITLV